jgi:hypothetical protein
MKSFNKNNIRLEVPAKWTGDDELYIIVDPINDCEDRQIIFITTQEAEDINYVITKYFIENDPDLLKVKQ